jgi:crotonobetainyl-CoA:carnitine CoA-transferase CaiB-like acyl-CoA transferase
MAGPLTGVRVLEFSQVIAGPSAGQCLADFGADVYKIAPPGGEPWRLQTPFAPQESKSYQTLNRGKRCVTLRLNHPDAQAIVHELIKTMDVVLVNYRPDVPARFNIDYASPKARDHPQYLAVPGTAK